MKEHTYEILKSKLDSLEDFNYLYNSTTLADHTDEYYEFYDWSAWGNYRCIYIGQLKEHRQKIRQGYGLRIFEDGELQQGFWVKNKINFYGRALFSTGNVYEGNFKNKVKHGYAYTFNFS